jgi:hypothetical protein
MPVEWFLNHYCQNCYQRQIPDFHPCIAFAQSKCWRSPHPGCENFTVIIFERIRHPPGCKCPANSSMVSHISNPASISLKGLNYPGSQRKAKERPESGQGKAKAKPDHLTVKQGEHPGFSELLWKIGTCPSSCDRRHFLSSVPSAHSPGHPGRPLKHFRGRRRRA